MKKIMNHIVKKKEIFIGLEDSKKTWVICVRSNKITINETRMPANYEVFKNYLNNNYPECKIHVIYEAGFRGFGLYDQLVADGFDCIVTPPHTVTEEKSQRQKNDRIDSRRLARNLENGDYHKCYVPSKQLREDRELSRLYEQIKRDINRDCNRIRRLLEFHGLDRDFPSGAWHKKQYRNAKQQLDEMVLSQTLRFKFNYLFDKLFYHWELQKNVLKEINLLAKSEPYKKDVDIIKSAPGIGLLTAIRLVLECGDINRFQRKEEFASYLRLVPGEYSSGEQEKKGHITKQGNRMVRSWLTECAWKSLKYDPVLLEKFNAVVSHNGSRKKAIVAAARKLRYVYDHC